MRNPVPQHPPVGPPVPQGPWPQPVPVAGKAARSQRRSRQRKAKLSGDPATGYTPDIALRAIDGHITRTGSVVMAWYRLAPQRWSFRPDHARNELLSAVAGQYAHLQGRNLHIRVTTRPYPIQAWAHAHVVNAHGRLPDVRGALSWDDYVLGEQRHLRGHMMSEKEVYLGVEVTKRNLTDVAVDATRPLLQRVLPKLFDEEIKALDAEIRHLDQVVAAPGLEGRPLSGEEMRWLLHRSCHLGLPAPRLPRGCGDGQWAAEDLAAITDGVAAFQKPYAPTVTVRARSGEHAGRERHLAVLTVGVMQRMQIPESEQPWMQKADNLGVPVEWSARIYVRTNDEVQGELRKQLGKVRSQIQHFEVEHGQAAPQTLERAAERAHQIDNELADQWGPESTRIKGWWRVAVSGDTEDEALAHAQELIRRYEPKIALEHPEAQYALAREFIPGEPLASSAYLRRGNVQFAAAAMPTAISSVGDRRGILLGDTSNGTRAPVAWDPWMAQEVFDGSGLTALVAGLGGGKSFLGGGIVYKSLRAGARWTVLDPSGPLGKLCEIPEIKPYARVINLLNAEPGILNPYRVVPEPGWGDYASEPGTENDRRRQFNRDRLDAAATRRRLCEDVLIGVLPHDLRKMAFTTIALKEAVRSVDGTPGQHPGMVIDALAHDPRPEFAAHAKALHSVLDEMRSRLALLIPEDDADPYDTFRDDRLTVLTMPGLVLPKDGVAREYWSESECLGVELLSLAAWLTQHMVYSGPAGYAERTGQPWIAQRKGVWIDEAFFLSEVPAGKALMSRFTRDSRKWNVRVLLSSQIPEDFLKIQGFAALLDSVFVGYLNDEAIQADALRMLEVPGGAGYESVLAQLARPRSASGMGGSQPQRDVQPREFVFRDSGHGIERIRVDFSGSHLAELRKALDTNPSARQSAPPIQQLPSASGDRVQRIEGVA